MLLSGFTFVRNAEKYDYPIVECLRSMLPLVDELIVNIGDSEDGTLQLVQSVQSDKIKIIHSVWDDQKTKDGLILSEQTNIALNHCQGMWALYLQADEILHENDYSVIRNAIADAEDLPVDGLRLRYLHFYGGTSLVQRRWNWYPNEIRILRRASSGVSYGDAQSFRHADGSPLSTKLIDAYVYHYGHAREPERMSQKIHYFHRFWHGDAHGIQTNQAYRLDLKNMVWFWGNHPRSFEKRVVASQSWTQSPEKLLPGVPKNIVIQASGASFELAVQLKHLIESKQSSTNVMICAGLFQWVRLVFRNVVRLGHHKPALVDLDAESRNGASFLFWLIDVLPSFQWRVAHAPSGKISRFRAFFYHAISWGRHERIEEGFTVPENEYAAQLSRWLGNKL